MFSSGAFKTVSIFNQLRSFSTCVVLNTSKEVLSKNKNLRLLSVKSLSKKRKKKCIVVKRVSDDIERIWLENLSASNLKLYRKTSVGSFKVINLRNLFERLVQIFPNSFPNGLACPDKENCPPVEPKTKTKLDGVKSPPCLSDFIIKHMVEFPMLKSENSFSKFAELEVQEFGAVDAVMFPSVTGILNDTMSYTARLKLKQWKDKMIQELGMEGFQKYQEDLLTEGSKFHSTIKMYLQLPDKKLLTVDPRVEGCWKSLETLLPDISDVQFVEQSVHHPVLMYKGIVDCVATYRGTPCVIEWKKTSKPRKDLGATYDAPLQLCAYLGALTWNKNVKVKNGLIVVAYTDGTPADVFELTPESCETYWIEWLRRVQSYWLRKSTKLVQEETNV